MRLLYEVSLLLAIQVNVTYFENQNAWSNLMLKKTNRLSANFIKIELKMDWKHALPDVYFSGSEKRNATKSKVKIVADRIQVKKNDFHE